MSAAAKVDVDVNDIQRVLLAYTSRCKSDRDQNGRGYA